MQAYRIAHTLAVLMLMAAVLALNGCGQGQPQGNNPQPGSGPGGPSGPLVVTSRMRIDPRIESGIPGIVIGVTSMAITPDGKYVVAMGTGDVRNLKIFEGTTGKEHLVFDNKSGSTLPVAVSPDGKWFAYEGAGGVQMRDIETGKQHRPLKRDSSIEFPWALAFSPKSDLLVLALDHTIVGWDVPGGEQRFAWKIMDQSLTSMVMLSDGKRLATGSREGKIAIWDIATQKPTKTLSNIQTEDVVSLAVSPDGSTMASFEIFRSLRVFEVSTGIVKHTIKDLGARAEDLLFLPDGNTLIYPDENNDINLMRVSDGAIYAQLKGHQRLKNRIKLDLNVLAVTSDGKTLFSGGTEGIFVWDLPPTSP